MIGPLFKGTLFKELLKNRQIWSHYDLEHEFSTDLVALVHICCASFPATAPKAVALPVTDSLRADLARHLFK